MQETLRKLLVNMLILFVVHRYMIGSGKFLEAKCTRNCSYIWCTQHVAKRFHT